MAKEVTISFKCDDDFADWLRRESFEQDKSASEIIRACPFWASLSSRAFVVWIVFVLKISGGEIHAIRQK